MEEVPGPGSLSMELPAAAADQEVARHRELRVKVATVQQEPEGAGKCAGQLFLLQTSGLCSFSPLVS